MSASLGRVCAVLGPTNTGKTHYAIERMMAYRTGVIGLPLRLLAREVYDKLVALRGPSVVALVTGEERIVPSRAQYWVATVEAMPQDIGAEFVAIDEVQLCADPERGHIFTDRLINLRGSHETLFMGSDTMRGPIQHLVKGVEFLYRDRFSALTYSGSRKLSRMRERTAIVGFSVDDVYAIAELLRRQKGGAAVVMGALSPRTRNAQVELYQNGDVNYLVATDAIGMGLNLDIDHVAFSSLTKFDGRRMRHLMPNELAQIAGRAGRHTNSGTFGVTGEASPLDEGVVNAIENHKFMPLKKLQWRNSRLEFGTVEALLASLVRAADDPVLVRSRESDDLRTLQTLSEMPEIRDRLQSAQDVRLLWEICQVPDFRGISAGDHSGLMAKLFEFRHLGGEIPQEWFGKQVNRLNNTTGDIDALSKRLAFIRTWTYVSQRKGWVSGESHWRDETRAIEDQLSDALHERLTQRFVDRRTSVLMRRLKQKESLVAEVNAQGEVTVEGEFVGKLSGFRFQLDKASNEEEAKTLRQAALSALAPEFALRSNRCYNAPDTEFDFTEQGGLMWGDAALGKLVVGADILSPQVEIFVDEEAGPEVAEKIKRRLTHFIERKIEAAFEPLIAIQKDETLTGLARGVGFRLVENLGVIPRSVVANDLRELDQDARGTLRKHGIRFGQYTLFQQLMLKPAPTRLRLVLWSLMEKFDEFPESPPPGLVTIPHDASNPKGYYSRAGYRLAGARAIRIDMLERLADLVRGENFKEGFEATPDMLSISGLSLEQFADLMQGLGYSVEKGERDKPAPISEDAAPKDTTETATPSDENSTDQKAEEEAAAQEEGQSTDTAPEKVVFYTFSWEPRRAQNAGNAGGKSADRRPKKGSKPKGGKSSGPKKASSSPRKPKSDKPIDPDNPFAALMALKNKS